jgi:hypothetical protein
MSMRMSLIPVAPDCGSQAKKTRRHWLVVDRGTRMMPLNHRVSMAVARMNHTQQPWDASLAALAISAAVRWTREPAGIQSWLDYHEGAVRRADRRCTRLG